MSKRRSRTTFQLPTHRRWNAVDAQRVRAAIERSGMAVSDFAREHGLRAGRIDLWRRRLGHHRLGAAPVFQEVDRATVSAALEPAPRSTVDLVFCDGRVLRFDAGLSVDRLGAIVRALDVVERC